MIVNKLIKKRKDAEEPSHHRPEPSPAPPADDESNWLVSYADMMTLLCGFFIMLFSMSKLDEPKYEAMKEAVAKEFGGEYKSEAKELAAFATQLLQENGLDRETAIKISPTGIAMVFQSTVFFDTLSSEVTPAGQQLLDVLLTKLGERQKTLSKNYKIVVEGHTDGRPVIGGSFASNWELSGARAARVVRMFIDKGYAPENLTAIGYADTRPEVPHRTPAGTLDETAFNKNRRVVIRVLNPKVDAIPFPDGIGEMIPDSAAATQAPASETVPTPLIGP